MQNLTDIERLVEPRLIKAFGEGRAKALWGGYSVARERAVSQILPYISRGEPHLTDHGSAHIQNVLNNAYRLLSLGVAKSEDFPLNPSELYFLVLSVLFHDLGNIHGRDDHNRRLQESFEFARGSDPALRVERRYLFAIVEAHCGQTHDGSRDTISRLEQNAPFQGSMIDCRRIAAVLRFADELAEGPQRTSVFVQKHLPYPLDSQVFHDFASVTDITIDPEGQRIVLAFNIDISFGSSGPVDETRLGNLLKLSYVRAVKLDLERKYNRHFCPHLAPFKKTEISYHFYFGNQLLELDIPKIVLDDLVLPVPVAGDSLDRKEKALELPLLLSSLKAAANGHTKASS